MRTAKLFVLFTRFVLALGMLCALGWSALAFAQADAGVTTAAQTSVAAAAAAGTGITLDQVLGWSLMLLGLIAGGILLPKLHAFLAAHEANKDASTAETQLWTVADKAEHFVEVGLAGIAPNLQADLAAGKPIGTVALDAAKSAETYLGTAGVAELGDVLGLGVGLVTKYLQDLAAKKVAEAQIAGTAAAAAITTGQVAVAAINKAG